MSTRSFDVMSKSRWILAGILLIGFALRLNVILGSTYHWDEEREWIPFALSISVEPGEVNLPIRAVSHPILPAYLIKLGSLVGGENPFGFRVMSLLAGVGTIWVVAYIALLWRGPWAAFWAGSLLSFNEYHIFISSLAIDKPFQLFFAALAIAGFVRFLQTENPKPLYFAGLMTGISFLCKETTVLLLPGFLAAMLLSGRHRHWFKRAAPYLAVVIFVAVISPDVFINLFLPDDVEFGYADQLQRAAGIGFTRHHFLFFARGLVAYVYQLTGQELSDLAPEYASMNSLLGLILLGVASWMALRLVVSREAREETVGMYLTIAFWAVFGFFLFTDVSTQGSLRMLTYVAWFWSDLTLIPACVLAGAFLISLPGTLRTVGYSAAGVAVTYAIGAAVLTRVGTPHGPIVAFDPEYVMPPNGQLVDVKARFNYCFICETDMSIALADVKLREPDGTVSSVLGTNYVTVPDDSPDGTELVLRARDADPSTNPDERWQERMWYDISYTLTDSAGRRQLVEDRIAFPLRPSEYGPRFWTGEVPGEAYLKH